LAKIYTYLYVHNRASYALYKSIIKSRKTFIAKFIKLLVHYRTNRKCTFIYAIVYMHIVRNNRIKF